MLRVAVHWRDVIYKRKTKPASDWLLSTHLNMFPSALPVKLSTSFELTEYER